LANATDQAKSLHPGQIENVLSDKSQCRTPSLNAALQANRTAHAEAKEEITINGKVYRSVNYTIRVSSSNHEQTPGPLVDRGANGGIAGSDLHVIETHNPGKTVNVEGVGGQTIQSLPMVTAGGVINTNHGEVIAILPQMAYLKGGKTILCPAQMEMYGHMVHGKLRKVTGLSPKIVTSDGYVH
jgi:hypothetical protein